jgi:hypothetical protein
MLASDLVRALPNRCLRDIFFVRRSNVWPRSIVKTMCASDEDVSMLDAPSRRQHRRDRLGGETGCALVEMTLSRQLGGGRP